MCLIDSGEAVERDELKNLLFKLAGLPLVRIRAADTKAVRAEDFHDLMMAESKTYVATLALAAPTNARFLGAGRGGFSARTGFGEWHGRRGGHVLDLNLRQSNSVYLDILAALKDGDSYLTTMSGRSLDW